MIHNVRAKFTANGVKVLAKLTTEEVVECITTLEAEGWYSSWWECPTGYEEHGAVNYVEQEVDNETATALFPYEWEFVDDSKQEYMDENPEAFKDVKIEEIVEIKDTLPDWKVDEDSLDE